VFDAGDEALGERAVADLGSGVTSSGSTIFTVPLDTAPGSYYIIARADGGNTISEVSETNNTRTDTTQIGPDLIVSALAAPATAGAGSTITVTDTTKNQGGGAVAPTVTRFYLSVNNVLDGADELLGERAVPALIAGQTNSGTNALTIPAGKATGTYYIIASADAAGAAPETQESNNNRTDTTQIGPDLAVTVISVPATAGAGSTITVTDTTKNQGGGTAGSSTATTFYFSANSVLDPGDTPLGQRSIADLAAGHVNSGSTSVVIPTEATTGTYYIIAKADGGNILAETQESNNTRADSVQLGPDLVVTSVVAPSAAAAGAVINVTDTTKNQGGSGVGGTTKTIFYLSGNATWDAGDTPLAERTVPALAAGASNSGSTLVTIPAQTPAGTHYVIAKSDGDNAAAETQENNNTRSDSVRIGPDLIVSSLTVPATAAAGATINVTDGTRNQGAGSAATSITRFYLSANTVLDGSDVELGERSVAALNAGQTVSGSTSLTIPAGTAPGNYVIIGKADASSAVPETQENNNNRTATLRVTLP
jgi:subtilase family serine protease